MVGMATARSSATCAVHLPVPFCPALSWITSTSGCFVSGSMTLQTCAVSSTRNDSSVPRFHSAKTSPICGVLEAEAAVQHVVDLGDDLHVAVLDAVVHHLHEMAGAVGTHVRDARAGIGLRRDRFEHVA